MEIDSLEDAVNRGREALSAGEIGQALISFERGCRICESRAQSPDKHPELLKLQAGIALLQKCEVTVTAKI